MGFPGKWLRYTVGLRPPGLRTCLLMPPTVAMIWAAQSGVSCRLIGKLEETTMIPSTWCGWVIVVCIIYICIYICMYICIYVCIYIYIYYVYHILYVYHICIFWIYIMYIYICIHVGIRMENHRL